ncbi:MAG: hypothetical protein SF052_16385 [Bacteroidia bacterium]|nr:hypothetical protein [Bacteroidia bacterium]
MRLFSRFSLLLSLCVCGIVTAPAQFISTEHIFAADGYSVFEVGYPLKVAQGTDHKFVFIEYWMAEKEKRRTENYYIQSYGVRDYVEHWFQPVTNEGFEPMQVTDLLRLENTYAVIGLQYFAEDKEVHTVSRFFALDGKSKTTEPIKLSTYTKKPKKDYEERIEVSPRMKYMVWMGKILENYYFSVWDGAGNEVWKKELTIPYTQDKYRIKDLRIDDKGNLYFLMEPNVPVVFRKEKKPLILVRYILEKEEFLTEIVELGGFSDVMDSHLTFLKNYDIIVAGVLSTEGAIGIRNGENLGSEAISRAWSHVFLKRYSREETNWNQLILAADSISPIPERWIKHYQENGANFSLSKIVTENETAVVILEEHYMTKKKLYYYDLGCLGFNTTDGSLIWNEIVEKRQRDSQSNAFMSYVSGVARDRLRLVYLSERGAAGELLCTSIELATGKRKDKMLVSNETSTYLFFPARSGMVSNFEMVLIGMGNPDQNDFKLITISF